MGCSQKVEYCEALKVNYDSLFSIGDSVLIDLYAQKAQQKMHNDSLSDEVFSYQIKLDKKLIQDKKQRIVYKDTVVYKKKIKTITDTVRKYIYLTDTIRDTVYVTKRELKKRLKK